MVQFKASYHRLRPHVDRLLREHPLLKPSLPVIALLLLMYLWGGLNSARSEAQSEAVSLRSELANLRGLPGTQFWELQREQERRALRAARARCFSAASVGQSVAALQQQLSDAGQRFRLAQYRVEVREPAPFGDVPGGQLYRVLLSLTAAEAGVDQIASFMQAFSGEGPRLRWQRMDTQFTSARRLELMASACVWVPGS